MSVEQHADVAVACAWCGFFSRPGGVCDVCGSPLPKDAPQLSVKDAKAALATRARPASVAEERDNPWAQVDRRIRAAMPQLESSTELFQELDAAQDALSERRTALEEETLRHREQRFQWSVVQLEEDRGELDRRIAEITEREARAAEREAGLSARETGAAEREADLAARHVELASRESGIGEKEVAGGGPAPGSGAGRSGLGQARGGAGRARGSSG